ncbi:1,6-anhydro-N-acetylmuramyl-L-alanine amidase AmpD [Pigmentiphaga soli]|uniref:1,6-anhydro-N-acetylmuramyl-L-alanine amidase AmpD n=1 Tax=Pigmentiphaga soli TaxID=1007095 RepID=A0ABP8GTX5_9BURK
MTAARLGDGGWLEHPSVRRAPSPNVDERPPGTDVTLLVLHNISLPPGRFGGPYIEALFTNTLDCAADPWFERLRGLRVSAHFLIARDGAVVQFAGTDSRAWHAGVSCFEGRERCNDFSIGIELEGCDDQPFTDAQYRALARLAPALRARHPIRALRGHEHIAPGRKTDPGPHFDWRRCGREGGWDPAQLPPQAAPAAAGALPAKASGEQ